MLYLALRHCSTRILVIVMIAGAGRDILGGTPEHGMALDVPLWYEGFS